ncbi:MAG: NADPH:quinone oxidoreductase family protein [Magnetospirillum sp.]|nr:NADPH:quinone oxidoreductase family protein [Magnetospirillum sp.]
MRAMVCPAHGQRLAPADLPVPTLGPGQVRIRVIAAGVNFADTLAIAGTYQDKLAPPFVPGLELSGTVIAVAPDVGSCRVGDVVAAVVTGGAFAEEAVAAAADVFVLPPGLDPLAAAGFPVVAGTAHLALAWKAALKPGETLVVHGAAGGVGLTAVEVGKALGARVIATAGGADKLRIARDHGADETVDSRSEDVRARIKALTGGRGADVVFDPVGGPLFEASLRSTAADGRLLLIGFAAGAVPQIPANILLVKNLTAIGFNWGAYRRLNPAALRESMETALSWWAAGRLSLRVSTVLPLAEAEAALDLLRTRRATGKVVVAL